MSDRKETEWTPEEEAAKTELEGAIEKFMSIVHSDSVILTAYILQASGSSPVDDRDLMIFAGKENQSGLLSAGLREYMNTNVDNRLYGEDPVI